MSQQVIHNCFDSHVHWLGTGQLATRLQLQHLASAEDIHKIKVEPHNFIGEWLVGFGWDQNKWPNQLFPTRQILDQIFPDKPVALSRADGHATWTNTEGLKRAGLWGKLPEIAGGKIITDAEGLPTGVLIDNAEKLIENIIPQPNSGEIRACLIKGMREFNKAGFTHIRDLTCREPQWHEATHLDEAGLLTMAVEVFFGAYTAEEFQSVLNEALLARKQKPTPNLRIKGIKIFCDGALGSEGALLSQCYCTGSGRGLSLLTDAQLHEFISKVWRHDFEVAVHVIGDEAAHRVAAAACKLWAEGFHGRLHLEHVELLRPETVALLKGQNIVCHIQPCHWHTDKQWLKQKLGDLYQFVFPWRALQEAGIEFYFGSDSPIEKPSIKANLLACEDSVEHGINKLLGSALKYHQHPDNSWAPNSFTHWADGQVTQVVFRGQHLF